MSLYAPDTETGGKYAPAQTTQPTGSPSPALSLPSQFPNGSTPQVSNDNGSGFTSAVSRVVSRLALPITSIVSAIQQRSLQPIVDFGNVLKGEFPGSSPLLIKGPDGKLTINAEEAQRVIKSAGSFVGSSPEDINAGGGFAQEYAAQQATKAKSLPEVITPSSVVPFKEFHPNDKGFLGSFASSVLQGHGATNGALSVAQRTLKSYGYEAPKSSGDVATFIAKTAESQAGATPPPPPTVLSTVSPETQPPIPETSSKTVVGDLVGERNVRIAQANQLAETLKKTLPLQEQEALTFYRDFKDNPQGLTDLLQDPKFDKYQGVIKKAIAPTTAMINADSAITTYFQNTLAEGKKLGFLDSNIPSDKYITHLLAPADQIPTKGVGAGAKVSRSTPFSKTRTYETVADAIQAGVKVKSLNALDALSIYGEKHAVSASTQMTLNALKESELGKFGFSGSENIPADWVVADPSGKYFRNTVPFKTPEGKPSVAYQNLYVPPDVAKALKPILATDFTGQLPGFSKTRLFQAYIKTVQLGLSAFHLRALNLTALNNEGVTGLITSYWKSMEAPEFLQKEQDFVKAGGISPVLGKTIEAYKGLSSTSIPSRVDILKKVTGIKAVDAFAKKITDLTFNIVQRKFKIQDFSIKEAKWMADNMDATDAELSTARRSIAKEVNAAYGGLNWETLGWSKSTVNITRFLMLAPDWTFSNFFNAKYAFEGGPAGSAARKFWIRSIITGVVLTYGMSTLINKKAPKANFQNFTNVYFGKDKSGKDVYQNQFFAGAPSDAVTLINNVADFGAIQGLANTLANKLSPAIKASIQLATNRNSIGQPIINKGMGPVAGTIRSLYTLLLGVSPVPFTVSNIATMMLDPKKQYSLRDYLLSLVGTRPRHVVPEGMREVPSGAAKGLLLPANSRKSNSLFDQVKTGNIYAPAKSTGGRYAP